MKKIRSPPSSFCYLGEKYFPHSHGQAVRQQPNNGFRLHNNLTTKDQLIAPATATNTDECTNTNTNTNNGFRLHNNLTNKDQLISPTPLIHENLCNSDVMMNIFQSQH